MKFYVPVGANPIHDISELKAKGILTYAQLCDAEAENILKAIGQYFHTRKKNIIQWFTEKALCQVHKEMFKDVWGWAGKYRQHVTNIGTAPGSIPTELRKLCEDVKFWLGHPESMNLLEQAARIHQRLAWIHPFENGNGRHARLIADFYLHSHGAKFPNWPKSLEGAPRVEYLNVIRLADKGDFQPLIDLMVQLTKVET